MEAVADSQNRDVPLSAICKETFGQLRSPWNVDRVRTSRKNDGPRVCFLDSILLSKRQLRETSQQQGFCKKILKINPDQIFPIYSSIICGHYAFSMCTQTNPSQRMWSKGKISTVSQYFAIKSSHISGRKPSFQATAFSLWRKSCSGNIFLMNCDLIGWAMTLFILQSESLVVGVPGVQTGYHLLFWAFEDLSKWALIIPNYIDCETWIQRIQWYKYLILSFLTFRGIAAWARL